VRRPRLGVAVQLHPEGALARRPEFLMIPSASSCPAKALLAGCRGFLHADGYGASDRCMSAIRRPICPASLKLHAGVIPVIRS
jgi:hypothetical protein